MYLRSLDVRSAGSQIRWNKRPDITNFEQEKKINLKKSLVNSYWIKIWNLNNYNCIVTLSEHTNYVWFLIINEEKDLLISWSNDKSIKIWDLITYKCIKTINAHAHTSYVYGLSFINKKNIFISCSYDQSIKFCDISTFEFLKTIEITNRIWILTVYNNMIFSGHLNGEIRLFN